MTQAPEICFRAVVSVLVLALLALEASRMQSGGGFSGAVLGGAGRRAQAPSSLHFELARVLCDPAPVPTVAYMFSGVPRTFAAPKVYLSFLRNVVHAFGAKPVFFFYFKTSKITYNDGYVMNDAPDEVKLSDAKRAEIESVLELFNPRVVVWEEDVDVRTLPQVANSKCINVEKTRVEAWRWKSQHYGVYRVMNLVLDYERNHSTAFDWVMKLRPDLLWYHGLKPYCGFDSMIAYDPNQYGDSSVPYPDWFSLVRGDVANESFDLFTPWVNCMESDAQAALVSKKLLEGSNRMTGEQNMPGYVLRPCDFGWTLEFCSYMKDKRYFANGECDAVLHDC